MDKLKKRYPQIYKLGCVVTEGPMDYVERKPLAKALKAKKIEKRFSELFGIQTQLMEGLYAHDVEAVLVRMFKGKLTGSQLIWD